MIPLKTIAGTYDLERDLRGAFVWARAKFSCPKPEGGHVVLHACYHGHQGEILLRLKSGGAHRIAMVYGWSDYVFPLAEAPETLEFEVAPVIPHEADPRELALMIRTVSDSDGPDEARRKERRHENYRLNTREFQHGAITLTTVPPLLRLSLSHACNVNPRCVYCHWTYYKALEGTTPVDSVSMTFLQGLGDYLALAKECVDCSIGEPFLAPEFSQVARQLVATGMRLSLTTNALLMTEDKYRTLLGSNAHICVSLDAPDAETYGWYRNQSFGKLEANVRRLCELKNRHGGPEVYISSLGMQSNYDKIEKVMELAADMGADGFILRSMDVENLSNLEPTVRNGHRFNYLQERLDKDQIMALAKKLGPRARDLGLVLIVDQLHYSGQSNASTEGPLCGEPWKTAYLMSRGIMPCCFGRKPLATWSEQGDRSLEAFVRDTLNSPAMRDIRQALASRELSAYCRSCPSCPIVKQATASQK